MHFSKIEFLLSTLDAFPERKDAKGRFLPEIALAGKSNVGKSSLINHFLGRKKIAKTSATPGKTKLLNFFSIEDRFLFVDLPGYGFAEAPLEEIAKWSSAIDQYLNQRASLQLLLLLIDSRREVGEQDQLLLDWAEAKKIPVLLIFTKTDKLKPFEKQALQKKFPEAILYSNAENQGRIALQKRIDAILWDYSNKKCLSASIANRPA